MSPIPTAGRGAGRYLRCPKIAHGDSTPHLLLGVLPTARLDVCNEALAEALDYTTLIFQAGSINTFSAGTLIIDRPLILKGYNVTIE